jgi:hypothetical protein
VRAEKSDGILRRPKLPSNPDPKRTSAKVHCFTGSAMAATPKVKNLQLTSDQKLLAGLQANASSLPSFVLAGQTVPPTQAISVMQARVNAGAAVVYQSAVQANRDELAQTEEFVSQLKTAIQLALSNAPDKMAEYGISPKKKPGKASVLDKVVAAAKRASTRKARNTMGDREKEKVKGAVPSTLTIAMNGPAAPIASASATLALAPTASTGSAPSSPSTVSGGNGSHGPSAQ